VKQSENCRLNLGMNLIIFIGVKFMLSEILLLTIILE